MFLFSATCSGVDLRHASLPGGSHTEGLVTYSHEFPAFDLSLHQSTVVSFVGRFSVRFLRFFVLQQVSDELEELQKDRAVVLPRLVKHLL